LDIKVGEAVFLEPGAYTLRAPDGSIVKKEKIDPEEDDEFRVDYDEKYYQKSTGKRTTSRDRRMTRLLHSVLAILLTLSTMELCVSKFLK
jgi:hypothetical protein